jgi:hypothetical protein
VISNGPSAGHAFTESGSACETNPPHLRATTMRLPTRTAGWGRMRMRMSR